MLNLTGGQTVVRVLEREQVEKVFCVPGESYLGVLDALYEHPTIVLISNRHENGASFMAEAYAKASGQVGVCMATRGVGVSNLSIGLHTAMQDSTPLVALIGQVERSFQGREAFQELNLQAMFAHMCKWTVEIDDPARIPEILHRAFHIARSGRPGPVLVALPHDLVAETVAEANSQAAQNSTQNNARDSAHAATLPDIRPLQLDPLPPHRGAVERAVHLIRASARPILLVGGGIRSAAAAEALVRFAELYQLPVVTAFRRFDVFPNSHSCYAGWLGFGPSPYVIRAFKEADLVLAVGTRLSQVTTQDYTLLPTGTPLVHVDICPDVFGKVYPATLAIQADAGEFLSAANELANSAQATAPSAPPSSGSAPNDVAHATDAADADRQSYVDALHGDFLAFSATSPASEGEFVDLKGMMHEVNEQLATDALITSDAGNFFGWVVKYRRFESLPSYIGPTSGAMGYGLPAAIAAKLAHPHRQVVCFSGDGGFMMTLQELETAVRYRLPVIAVVVNNNLYGTIRAHQQRHFPGRVVGTQLGNPNFARLAETFGAHGAQARTNREFREALANALVVTQKERVPAVIEVFSDPAILSVGAQR